MKQEIYSKISLQQCEICMVDLTEEREFIKICSDQNTICDNCLDSWIQQQLHLKSTDTKREFFFMKCPFSSCKKLFDLQSFLKRVNINRLPKTDLELFKNYCRESNSVTNCPNSQCNNIGFFNPKETCRQNLQCDKCQYKWRLPSQKYPIEQIFQSLSGIQLRRKGSNEQGSDRQKFTEIISDIGKEKYEELKTLLYKLVFSKSCGKCGIFITRTGGCKQMRCERCHHHFCWDCGQPINYQHKILKCTILQTIKVSVLLSPFFAIYYKLGFFTFLQGIQFIPNIKFPNTIRLGCKLHQKLLGFIGLFIRIFAYHSPIKILHVLLQTIQKYFPNALSTLTPLISQQQNKKVEQQRQQQQKLDDKQSNFITQKQKYIQVIKWALLLISNLALLKQFGSGKEVLGILGIESMLSLFLITNHLV